MTIDYRYRANQVYWICLFTCLLLVMNITKMAYREARPFWIDPTVYQGDCSSEFGNPSGHSMTAALLAVALAFSILELVSGESKRRLILGLLIFPVALLYFFAMGLSRLTLGVHSVNQILYGWLWGIWLAVAGHFCLRDLVIAKAKSFLNGTTFPTVKELLIVSGAQAVGVGVQIAVYYIVDAAFDPPATWSAVLVTLCGKDVRLGYHHESFKAIGFTFAAFGAYWGLVVQQRFLHGQLTISNPSRLAILKWVGRLAVVIVLVVPWAAILVFVKLENMWANLFVKKALAIFGLAFTLTAVNDWVCLQLRLYDRSHNPVKLFQ